MNALTLVIALELIIPIALIIVSELKACKYDYNPTAFCAWTCSVALGVLLLLLGILDMMGYTAKVTHYNQTLLEVAQAEREPDGITGELTNVLADNQIIKGNNGKNYTIRVLKSSSLPELEEGYYKEIKLKFGSKLMSPIGLLLTLGESVYKESEEQNIYIHRTAPKIIIQPETTAPKIITQPETTAPKVITQPETSAPKVITQPET